MQIGWLAAAPSPDLLPAGTVFRAGKTKAQGAFFFPLRAAGYDGGGTLILGDVCGILCASQCSEDAREIPRRELHQACGA